MNVRKKLTIYAIIDFLIITLSWLLSFLIVEGSFVERILDAYYLYLAEVVILIVGFYFLGMYSIVWRYAGIFEGLRLMASVVCVFVCNIGASFIGSTLDFAWAIVVSTIIAVFLCASRSLAIIFDFIRRRTFLKSNDNGGVRVIVIGAGDAGSMLIRELRTSPQINYFPVCALDDNENKIGQYVNGVKVVGKTSQVVKFANLYKAEEIIIAIPSISRKAREKIVHRCEKTNCKIKTVPSIYQITTGKVAISNVKEIDVKDLLGREQVDVNLDEIMGYIENKVIMVTGGGGSIGSELCRQIAGHNPQQLIIVDIYENNAYEIQQELLRHFPTLNLVVLVASVRDSTRINNIFEKYKPQIVFHAAAHKHVPLMEDSPNEAVKNNVSGTYKLAEAAGKNGVKKFILISTDKAVNPTNIMGATKRICEMIIQAMNHRYTNSSYVAVRFGNVLGSNGSVIPQFKKQIEEGGPVTITHKDIVRYFMTIPEAVSLVLQAGAYAEGGEIFVLDMGEPVKIYDLAVNMIKYSGLEPNVDIDIKIIGLRPGEKLYEERLMQEEGLKKTKNQKISIGKPLDFDEEKLFNKIQELYNEAYNETDKMKELVHELVPTYTIDKRES